VGYAEASAEAISREAGMSPRRRSTSTSPTRRSASSRCRRGRRGLDQAVAAAADEHGDDGRERVRAGVRAFLTALEVFPDQARTLLVEIIGAGPRAAERRDAILEDFAGLIHEGGRTASIEDAYAVVGAIVELASRHLRHGRPEDVAALEPVIARLIDR
jgi:hypothetical protein